MATYVPSGLKHLGVKSPAHLCNCELEITDRIADVAGGQVSICVLHWSVHCASRLEQAVEAVCAKQSKKRPGY